MVQILAQPHFSKWILFKEEIHLTWKTFVTLSPNKAIDENWLHSSVQSCQQYPKLHFPWQMARILLPFLLGQYLAMAWLPVRQEPPWEWPGHSRSWNQAHTAICSQLQHPNIPRKSNQKSPQMLICYFDISFDGKCPHSSQFLGQNKWWQSLAPGRYNSRGYFYSKYPEFSSEEAAD